MAHHPRRFTLFLSSALLVVAASLANAQVTFDWATVGDVGNAADDRVMTKGGAPDNTTGYGSVDHEFRIATTHVTNDQYVAFLNAVDPSGSNSLELYNSNMTSSEIGNNGLAYAGGIDFDSSAADGIKYAPKTGQANYAANWINWNSSARFINWLNNGQGNADTENGVYDMSQSTVGPPQRQADAAYFIPSENEFYKAAYYDPAKGGSGGYWEYGVQSDSAPASVGPPGDSMSANVRGENDNHWQTGVPFDDSVDYRTEVGAYSGSTSHYGLLDVDGLVYQWTEATKPSFFGDPLPTYRGGSWYYDSGSSGASHRALYSFRGAPSYAWFGLRVAAAPGASAPDGDFDMNGTFDCADINALGEVIAAGSNDAAFDLTGDGIVNLADRDAWLVAGGAAQLPSGGAYPVGDANLSGTVDSTDLGLLLNNFGGNAVYCGGDLDADASVDSTDLGLLLNSFGSSASASAVPEPQPSLLLLVVLLAFARKRE